MTEATVKLLIRVPDALARRFKQRVPAGQRSRFIEQLLAEALRTKEIVHDASLYQDALAIEEDERLASEMAEWEEATIGDGFDHGEREKPTK